MHKIRAALVGLLCLVAVGGCTTNNTIANTNFTTQVTMELAVGTLNDSAGVLRTRIFGAARPAGTLLNAIAVFRNQFGNSAFSNPGTAELTPTADGPCNATTGVGCNIGQNGGNRALYSYGQKPGVNGLKAAAPAWAAPGSGTGFLQDVILHDLPPLGAGGTAYTLTDSVLINSAQQLYSASATLNAVPTVLTAPANATYAPAVGTGGGTVTFGPYPAGATEQVVVFFSSAAATSSVVAMAEICTSGCPNTGVTATLPPLTLAPGAYTCVVIAADFPWVEAGVVNSPAVGVPNPVIVGANGNADMSVGGQYSGAPCTQT